jgi:hypothetical protein
MFVRRYSVFPPRGVSGAFASLLHLYRKYGQLGKRTFISNKLYRLSKRGLIWVLAGKKGIYFTNRRGIENDPEPAPLFDHGSERQRVKLFDD